MAARPAPNAAEALLARIAARLQGEALAGRGLPPDRSNLVGGRLLLHLWGTATHCVVLAIGFLLLANALLVGSVLAGQAQEEPWAGLLPSLKIFGNIMAMPFSGLPTGEDPVSSSSVEVVGLWVPLFMSTFLLLIAFLGLATLRGSGISAWQAAIYAVLAAVLLVWQGHAGQVIGDMASWEDLANARVNNEVRGMQHHLFKVTYKSWMEAYTEYGCNRGLATNSQPVLECSAKSLEGQLMSVIVQDRCRAQFDDPNFAVRSQQCLEQGLQHNFLDSLTEHSDVQFFYCQCRTATFDFLGAFSQWFVVFWVALLLGILASLYAAAEPQLYKMVPQAHCEIVLFGALGTVVLAVKAMLFADDLPWSTTTDNSNWLLELVR